MNEAIRAQGKFPKTFSYTDTDPDSGEKITIEGEWSSWELSPGGAGQNVQMACVVSNGRYEYVANSDGGGKINQHDNLEGAELIIQVSLRQVASSDPVNDSTANNGTAYKLVVNAKPSGNRKAVSIISSPSIKSKFLQSLVSSAFENYFNTYINQFNHTFAVINLNSTADKDGFQWLKPTTFQYAVASPGEDATVENSVFGLLAMVDGNKKTFQMPTVDTRALVNLPDGANSAFVISRAMVASHILMQGALETIQGSKLSDFQIDNGSITNVNPVTWGNFQTEHGVISPTIASKNFVLRVDGNYISLSITDAEYSMTGITVHMTFEQKFSFHTIQRTDGKYVFIPEETGFNEPQLSVNISLSKPLEILEDVFDIISLAIVIFGPLGKLLARVIRQRAVVNQGQNAVNLELRQMGAAAAENPAEVENANRLAVEDMENAVAAGGGAAAGGLLQRAGILLSPRFRLTRAVITSLSFAGAASLHLMGSLIKKRYDKMPEFDKFAAHCLGASQWPGTNGYTLLSARFCDSLVIAVQLKSSKP